MLFLFSEIGFTLKFEQRSHEYLKDEHEQDEDEDASADIAECDIEACIILLVVELDQGEAEENERYAALIDDFHDVGESFLEGEVEEDEEGHEHGGEHEDGQCVHGS